MFFISFINKKKIDLLSVISPTGSIIPDIPFLACHQSKHRDHDMKNDFNLKPSYGFRGDSCHIWESRWQEAEARSSNIHLRFFSFFLLFSWYFYHVELSLFLALSFCSSMA